MRFLGLILAVAACAPIRAEEPIRLVVRGDDFGYTHASNIALPQAFDGIMTSASVLVPGPWFSETAALAAAHPEWSVGVHLTITSEWNRLRWRPVSPITAVPSLVAPDGYLWAFGYQSPKPADWSDERAPWAEHPPDPREAEIEFRAQIERARALGVRLDYVDCHMGMACRDDLMPVTEKLAKEYCLAISGRTFGEKRASPKYPNLTPAGVKAGLREMLEGLTPGLWLFVAHPAARTPELEAVDTGTGSMWAERRSSVLASWTDPEIRTLMEERGIELVSMRDLWDAEACAPR